MNNHYNTCPTAKQFTLYLTGKGKKKFNNSFEKHLATCQLCQQAIAGYKLVSATPAYINYIKKPKFITTKTKNIKLAWSVAASLTLLIATAVYTTLYFTYKTSYNLVAINDCENMFTNQTIKTLGTKNIKNYSHSQYWTVDQNNQLIVNDSYISPTQINKAINNTIPVQQVIVEISTNNVTFANQLIKQIKSEKKVPVYTFSKPVPHKKN